MLLLDVVVIMVVLMVKWWREEVGDMEGGDLEDCVGKLSDYGMIMIMLKVEWRLL